MRKDGEVELYCYYWYYSTNTIIRTIYVKRMNRNKKQLQYNRTDMLTYLK